jgi:choice-of-anchor C domain-containing protein
MKKVYLLAVIFVGAQLCLSQTVLNGSFETGTTPPFGGTYVPAPNSSAIPNWTVQSGSVDYIGSDTWQAADGSRSLDMSGHNAGSILQNITGFTVGQQYRLSFYIAGNDGDPPIKHLQAAVGSTAQTFTFDTTGFTYANMGWSLRTLDFTADNTTLALTFTSFDDTFSGPAIDNVSISPIPEPCASYLICAGCLGLLRRIRRL